MKQITLNIPEQQVEFFMNLIKRLGFEALQDNIPEEHKKIVRDRIKNTNTQDYVSWESIENQITFD
jgi:hypothetical protein